jgi:DNA-binding SARP family transcriptional activator/tetratricopeptide (TPR) repeat protein
MIHEMTVGRAETVEMLAGELRIGLLGPFEVTIADRQMPVRGRPREMLAMLALTPARTVSYKDLSEAVWGDLLPEHPRNSLHTIASRLRSVLGADSVVPTSGGYQLWIEEQQVDLFRFRRMVAESRIAAEQPNSDETELRLLDSALRLWRGPALVDVRSRSLHLYQVPRITEEWFDALERRQELELSAGRLGDLIAELRELTTRYPLRESVWARLIRALHLAGRQADAFAAYGDIVAQLREDLGADPGADLARAHDLILRGAPVLPGEAAPQRTPAGTAYPPRELPADLRFFVGRKADLAALDELIAQRLADSAPRAGVAVIDGSAGVGKTALAIHWANSASDSFPDGQIYLNLRGFGPVPPIDVGSALRMLLRTLGVPTDDVPDDITGASSLLRTVSTGKRILFVFDNASSTEQIDALLPGAGCLALITSRNQLRGLVAREAAVRISLSPLNANESVTLLAEIAGGARVSSESGAAGRLAELCDHTPLALRILAERIARQPGTRLAEFVEDLLDAHDRLDSFDAGDDSGTNLRTVLSWSYSALEPDTARTFRLVGGLHPGSDISLPGAAAVAGISSAVAQTHLDRLAAVHLLEQRRHDRYQLHDLVRAFAAERCHHHQHDEFSQRETAVRRILDWYLHTADNADRLIAPHRLRHSLEPPIQGVSPLEFTDIREVVRWYDAEYQNLITLPGWAFAEGAFVHCYELAFVLQYITIWHHARYHDLLDTHEVALAAAIKMADFRMQGDLLNVMGIANADLGRIEESQRCHERAVAAFRRAGDGFGEAKVLGNAASLMAERGDYTRAKVLCEQSLALSTELGYERNRALNLDTLGEIHFAAGDHVSAIACWRRAMEVNARGGNGWAQVINVTNLGRAYAAVGRHERAIRYYRKALSIGDDLGSRRTQASPLLHLGHVLQAFGDIAGARRTWGEALSIMEEVGDVRADEVRGLLLALDRTESIWRAV